MAMARGSVRCGSTASASANVTYCHPSYAHSTEIMARPTPAMDTASVVTGAEGTEDGSPRVNSRRLIRRMAATLMPVATFLTEALPRVPSTLITAITTMSPTETTFFASGVSSENCPR